MKRVSLFVTVAALAGSAFCVTSAELQKGFENPPNSAKPHTWWHWMNGNVSKEGITADLEAMKAIGLGGAQIFDAGCDIPEGPIAYNTPEWFDVIKHAAAEARRLGLELCLPNCSGWSSSGGPWNPAKNSMKFVVFTETDVTGPTTFNGTLRQPPDPHGFYEDIAVLAYPVPNAERGTIADFGVAVTSPLTKEAAALGRLIDGKLDRPMTLRRKDGKSNTFTYSFQKPYRATSLVFALRSANTRGENCTATVEAAADGKTFKPVGTFQIQLSRNGRQDNVLRALPFDPVEATAFRIAFTFKSDTSTYQLAELSLERKLALSGLQGKIFRSRSSFKRDTLAATADQVVPAQAVVNLTQRMGKDGKLTWDAPAGNWKLLRIGYAANGRCNHPASSHGRGFEVDKLSKEAMDYHFEAYVGKLCKYLGPLAGKVESGLNNILVDSYEVDVQNWTQGFDKTFAARCGYSLVPYLPVFSGHIVESVDKTERFLWDYRRVIADLFAENYAGELAKKCHEYGLLCSIEPYGNAPCDDLQYGQDVDVPMGEFWVQRGIGGSVGNSKFPAALAHVWGRRFVGAEAFTASPESGKWLKDPYGLKAQGDQVYCKGVNRIIYHRYTHQPWTKPTYYPGMTMGQWGTHFERTLTWWDQGKDWVTYQSRCQYMLQEGVFVGDALFYCGEDAPNNGSRGSLPKGYDWDWCATDALKALKVENGNLVVPGGTRYRMLVLPDDETMTPATLRVIGALQEKGAVIVGRVKPLRSPGLAGYPKADQEVKALADAIWAKGVLTCTPQEALKKLAIEPDFVCLTEGVDPAFIHRRYDDGTEAYFLSTVNPSSIRFDASFRTAGRVPELWDATTGRAVRAPLYRVENGRTIVTLDFEPSGSVFVVFRAADKGDHMVAAQTVIRDFAPEALPEETHTLEIIKAEYGSFPDEEPPEAMMVTSLVRQQLGKPILVENNTFGRDPAAMIPKQLLVEYALDNQTKRVIVDEHKTVTVPDKALVSMAIYGVIDPNWKPPQKTVVDVTAKLRSLVDNGTLSAKMGNNLGGDPIYMTVKKSVVTYRLDGKVKTVELPENAMLTLPPAAEKSEAAPDYQWSADAEGRPTLAAWKTMTATAKMASGKEINIAASVPAPQRITGAWELAFPAGWGAPDKVTLPKLISWTDHADKGIRYFSGTATYTKTVKVDHALAPNERIMLDLGNVKNLAEVSANGIAYPVLWRPPFRVDVTDAVKKGNGTLALSIKVTNLWPNRLIGDDELPDDCEWRGIAIKEIPQWVKEGKPSPTGRLTFTTWHHWTKGMDPLPSGIMGPVYLRSVITVD